MKMNVKRNASLIALFMMALTARAWDGSENQLWMNGDVSGKLAEKVSLKLSEQIRYVEEGDLFSYKHTDLCATYGFSTAWKFSAGFRHIYTRKSAAADWTNKEMVHFNAINTLPVAGLDFKTRMRLCYTEADNTDYLMDVRPEFCLMPTKGFTDWKLKPYLSDEIFYNLNETHLYRNRVSVGLNLSPIKSLSLKFFIMHENTQKTEEKDFNENFNYGLFAGYKF